MPAAAGNAAAGGSPLHPMLASRGHRHVSYADWLMIEAAEKELAARLGRGARVKLPSKAEIHKACGLS
jgi:ferredoxin/flavodoxin---NADP+ reductase